MNHFLAKLAVLTAFWLMETPLWAALPYPPEPLKGTLLVVSDGDPSDGVRNEFVKLAGGKENAKIVIIYSKRKADADAVVANWKKLVSTQIDLVFFQENQPPEGSSKLIEKAASVWFDDPAASEATLASPELSKAIRNVFDRGGLIAGQFECGDLTSRGKPGWGFLPGLILQANEADPATILQQHPGYAVLSTGNHGSILIRGRRVKNMGDQPAKLHLGKSPDRSALQENLRANAELDLIQIRRAAFARNQRPEFPPKEPSVPEVAKGSLVIVGGGGTTQAIMDRFFKLAGGKDSLIVVIPTANEEEIIPADPSDAKYLRKWGATNVKVLHTRDRLKANDSEFSKVLTEAKGIWFGGGRQWRFVDAYEGTLTEKRFHDVLARGGVIGGSSAGASIQSEYMPRGHPLGNLVVAAEGYEHGFGFLPGCAVDQHFFARKRTADMTAWMKNHPSWLGIGLDEATAIIVSGHVAEVIGRSKVAFYDYRKGIPLGDKDYIEIAEGGKFDLKERKLLPR